jgi:hypothetical protein
VVVAVGLTLIEPLAEAELNAPGEIETEVAPLVAQLSVLLAPELMLPGLVVKDAIAGIGPLLGIPELGPPPQLVRPAQASKTKANAR